MSEYRFTYGNLIVLYAIFRGKASGDDLPDYVKERIRACLDTYRVVMNSKPDKERTMVIIVGKEPDSQKVKRMLVEGGVQESIIGIDSGSESVAQTFDHILHLISPKANPPYIYFVGSVWLHDIYTSTVISKMKGYRTQFIGAPDHRPVDEVEREKALDVPKKGKEYYKQKIKDKAVDTLLNIIFPE
jgi:hypothetical protein